MLNADEMYTTALVYDSIRLAYPLTSAEPYKSLPTGYFATKALTYEIKTAERGLIYSWRFLDHKQYELSDHLGNVRAVIGDVKRSNIALATLINNFRPILKQATDYYAFGSPMPGRKYDGGYRFGFNGQEQDDEVAGDGNTNTAEFWEYDTRLGRRWDVDPVDQIGLSGFQSYNNNPIFFIDSDGDVVKIHISNKAVGYTKINLYNSKEVRNGYKQKKVRVPVYKVTVTNEEA